MKTILIEDYLIKCITPDCVGWSEYENTYSTHLMIWCDECGARSVIDTRDKKELKDIDLKSILSGADRSSNGYDNLEFDINNGNDVKIYEVHVCYILRVSNVDLEKRMAYTQDYDKIKELVRTGGGDGDNFVSYNHLYDVRSMSYKSAESDDDTKEKTVYYLPFSLYLKVDSYDVMSPKEPYPPNFDTSHDGRCIYLDCLDAAGNEFRAEYDGD